MACPPPGSQNFAYYSEFPIWPFLSAASIIRRASSFQARIVTELTEAAQKLVATQEPLNSFVRIAGRQSCSFAQRVKGNSSEPARTRTTVTSHPHSASLRLQKSCGLDTREKASAQVWNQ